MPLSNRLNARKPWTPDDIETLQRLVAAAAPPKLIADRLGRSIMSVSSQAEKLGVGLGKNRAARVAERDEARRSGAEAPSPGRRGSQPGLGTAVPRLGRAL